MTPKVFFIWVLKVENLPMICHRIEPVSYVLEAETVKGQSTFTQNVGGPVFDRGGQGLNR